MANDASPAMGLLGPLGLDPDTAAEMERKYFEYLQQVRPATNVLDFDEWRRSAAKLKD